MLRFLHVAAAVVMPLVSGVRLVKRSDSTVNLDGVHAVEGVPILNYQDRLAQKEVGLQSDDDVFDWILILWGNQSDAAINEFCEGEDGCKSRGHQGGVPFVTLHGSEPTLAGLIRRHIGQVEFVEPLYKIDEPEPAPEEDDVDVSSYYWNLPHIGVDSARKSGKGVNIYVFDTGIHVTHGDFGGRAKRAIDVDDNGDIVDCTRSGSSSSCATDTNGHGTHCASIAGGGRFGVAKQATIWAARVCCFRNDNIIAGLGWVQLKGKRPGVVSMSLNNGQRSNADKRAVDDLVESGITVIVSAGNHKGETCDYGWGWIPSAISVGATDSNDQRAQFSNSGNCNDIFAPGVDIVGARGTSGIARNSGTSQACPHVAGAVAMLLEANPSRWPGSVKRALLAAAETGKISGLKSGDPDKLLNVRSF